MKLRHYLILIFCLLALVPVLLFRAWPQSKILETEIAEVAERHLLLARSLALSLERYQNDIGATFRLLAGQRDGWGLAADLNGIMTALNIRNVCIVESGSGLVVERLQREATPCPHVLPADLLMRLEALAVPDAVRFGEVVGARDGSNVIQVVLRLGPGRLAVASIGTDYFRALGERVLFGERGHAAIVDQAGNALSHPNKDWVAERRNLAGISAVQHMMAGRTGVDIFYSPAMDAEMIAGFTSVEPVGWGVMVPQPLAELQAKADNARRSASYVLLIGVAAALCLALIISVVAARPLEHVTASARRISKGDFRLAGPTGSSRFMPLEVRQLLAAFREMVVHLRKSRNRIHRLAFQDRVTGLSNRECFRRRAEAFIDDAGPKDVAALLFIDLDGFKEVNDTVGHDAGDDVLGQVGARLRAVVDIPEMSHFEPILKDYQTAPSLARLGGDEFAVFLPNVGARHINDLTERILKQLAVPFPHGNRLLSLGASIGIATLPSDAIDFSGLLKCADIAMYEAKRRGKNQVRSFRAGPQIRRNRRQQMAEDLFGSDVTAQIETHFQPVYRAKDLSVTGVEALIRWQHPKYGLLTPPSFFEMVAELGLGSRIDDIAFTRSVQAIEALSAQGVVIPEMSLNIPVERLSDGAFVSRALALEDLPFVLGFELTETSVNGSDLDQVQWAIDELREAGVRFELDDFGSARGSISAMLDIAPHRIKIDQRLTRNIHTSGASAGLLRSLVGMAHDLDVEVVAKGVERVEQIDCLVALGVDHLQGFALNHPLSARELSAHLHAPLPCPTEAS